MTFDPDNKTFITYVVLFVSSSLGSEIYLFCKAQIAFLKADEIFNFIASKFVDFIDVFFKNLVAKLLEYIKIDNYALKLIKSHQPYYTSIYNLK